MVTTQSAHIVYIDVIKTNQDTIWCCHFLFTIVGHDFHVANDVFGNCLATSFEVTDCGK